MVSCRARIPPNQSIPSDFTRWHQLACRGKPSDTSTMLVQRRSPQAKQRGIEPNRDIAEAY